MRGAETQGRPRSPAMEEFEPSLFFRLLLGGWNQQYVLGQLFSLFGCGDPHRAIASIRSRSYRMDMRSTTG